MRIFSEIYNGFVKGGYIGYRLFLKASRSERANSKWGTLWEFAEPITLAAIFLVLRQSDILHFDEGEYPFVLFLISGLMSYQLASSTIIRSLLSIPQNSSILDQVNVPAEALFVTNYLRFLMDSAIMFFVIIVVVVIFAQISLLSAVISFLILQLLGLGAVGVGMVLAPINVLYGDISQIVTLLIRPMMFISPIFYSDVDSAILEKINDFNPFAHFLLLYRGSLFNGNLSLPISWWVVLGGSMIILIIAILFFHVALPALNRKS